jgi:hypothetical protein
MSPDTINLMFVAMQVYYVLCEIRTYCFIHRLNQFLAWVNFKLIMAYYNHRVFYNTKIKYMKINT